MRDIDGLPDERSSSPADDPTEEAVALELTESLPHGHAAD